MTVLVVNPNRKKKRIVALALVPDHDARAGAIPLLTH